jgi:hypothetical protein
MLKTLTPKRLYGLYLQSFFFYFLQRQPSTHRDTPNYYITQHRVLFQTTYPNVRSFTYQKPAFLPTFSPFPASILVNPYPPSHFHHRALNRRISKPTGDMPYLLLIYIYIHYRRHASLHDNHWRLGLYIHGIPGYRHKHIVFTRYPSRNFYYEHHNLVIVIDP